MIYVLIFLALLNSAAYVAFAVSKFFVAYPPWVAACSLSYTLAGGAFLYFVLRHSMRKHEKQYGVNATARAGLFFLGFTAWPVMGSLELRRWYRDRAYQAESDRQFAEDVRQLRERMKRRSS